MKKIIIVILIILGGIGWLIYGTNRNTKEYKNKAQKASPLTDSQQPPEEESSAESQKEEKISDQSANQDYSNWLNDLSQNESPFPPPSVNKIGDIMQRTIHVGVRQWEWVPIKMNANYGERVVLIMHNADVPHSISVPDLNVRQDIPDDGAVVQFVASKRGTFTFFCDTPCGKDHDKMKGTIIIV